MSHEKFDPKFYEPMGKGNLGSKFFESCEHGWGFFLVDGQVSLYRVLETLDEVEEGEEARDGLGGGGDWA